MWHRGFGDPECLPICQLCVICSPVQDEPQSGKQSWSSGMLGRSPNSVESVYPWCWLEFYEASRWVCWTFCLATSSSLYQGLVSMFKRDSAYWWTEKINNLHLLPLPDVKRCPKHSNKNHIGLSCFCHMSNFLHPPLLSKSFSLAFFFIAHVFLSPFPTATR